ncbi:Glucose 1-dehydrogenase [Polaromonas sp. CG9_12]|nr:Glucose 1-dehydrogenase [Polaromonas sp. CG9_12]
MLAMFAVAVQTLGTVDILINNAGIQRDADLLQMSLDDWQQVIAVNLTGQFLCAREAAREFLRRGVVAERSCAAGKLICISSVHQRIPWAGHINHAASKDGVAMLMTSLAQEPAPQRIRVNSIAPGAIKTDINRDAWATPDEEARLLQLILFGRVGNAQDVAKAAVWLASDESDCVTGATLYVDGGMVLYPALRNNGEAVSGRGRCKNVS